MGLSIGSTSSVSSTQNVTRQRPPDGPPRVPEDQTDLSRGAQLMKQLDELSKSDPEKFKQVAADLAEQLSAAADETTGDDAQHLEQLAAAFSEASETGKLPEPPRPPEGGGQARGYPPSAPPDMTAIDDLIGKALGG